MMSMWMLRDSLALDGELIPTISLENQQSTLGNGFLWIAAIYAMLNACIAENDRAQFFSREQQNFTVFA